MSGIQNHVTYWLEITKRMRNEKKIFLTIHNVKNKLR